MHNFHLLVLMPIKLILIFSKTSENAMSEGRTTILNKKINESAVLILYIYSQINIKITSRSSIETGQVWEESLSLQKRELKVRNVAAMETTQINREGRRVIFRSLLSPKNPANVIMPSAATRANVPASVDRSPPL